MIYKEIRVYIGYNHNAKYVCYDIEVFIKELSSCFWCIRNLDVSKLIGTHSDGYNTYVYYDITVLSLFHKKKKLDRLLDKSDEGKY